MYAAGGADRFLYARIKLYGFDNECGILLFRGRVGDHPGRLNHDVSFFDAMDNQAYSIFSPCFGEQLVAIVLDGFGAQV